MEEFIISDLLEWNEFLSELQQPARDLPLLSETLAKPSPFADEEQS
jgi:hypothetical protein